MYLLSIHLTMSRERLGVWNQNWVIIRERDKSILAWNLLWKKRLIVTVLLIILILVGCFFFFLKHVVGVMYLPGSKDISTKSDGNEWCWPKSQTLWKWIVEEKKQCYSYQPWMTATSGRRHISLKVWFSCNFYPNSYFMWLLCKFFLKMMYAYLCACMLCVLSVNKHGTALTSCRLL